MRFLLSCISVLSAAAIAAPAVAAELPARPKRAAPERAAPRPAPQPQQQGANWNGGQVGGSNGGSSVNNNFVEPGAYNFSGCSISSSSSSSSFGSSPVCAETPFSFSGTPSSYIGGGFFGYRVQIGSMVVGVEGDVYYQNAETSYVQTSKPSWLASQVFTGSIKQGTDGSFRGRIGGLITPWTLLYATGGVAIGEISGSFSYSACSSASSSSSSSCAGTLVAGAASWSDTRIGGTIGAGAETELFPGWKARLEYRYTDYGRFSKDVPLGNNVSGPCSPTICGSNAVIDLRASNHRVTVGLGFDL
jgi:outer membrane immunogenic protein